MGDGSVLDSRNWHFKPNHFCKLKWEPDIDVKRYLSAPNLIGNISNNFCKHVRNAWSNTKTKWWLKGMIICHLIFTAASCSQIYFYIRVRPPFQFTKMIGSEMSISTDQNRRPHQLPYTFKISREFSSFSNFTLSKVNFDFKSSKCSLIKLKGAIL